MTEYSRIPWGSWDLNGNWYPNPALKMSPDEQFRRNVEAGYIKNVPLEIKHKSNNATRR